jgi:hypothetical protein
MRRAFDVTSDITSLTTIKCGATDPFYNQTKANPEFQATFPGAKLEGVESMRGTDENRDGRSTSATTLPLALRSSGDM